MKIIKQDIRVLVAEDNTVISKMIEKALQKIGYEMIGIAENGVKAVEIALAERPDVILMDIEMPKLNGLDATRKIQEQYPIPIVILTAHEEDDFIKKAGKVGASAYLIKPPNEKDIERAIIMALARHGDLMECWRLNNELHTALTEIKRLRGILPLCSFCKKIRDDKGFWNQVDVYISEHSDANISHSVCPECLEKHYPEVKKRGREE